MENRKIILHIIMIICVVGGVFIGLQFPDHNMLQSVSKILIGFSGGILLTLFIDGTYSGKNQN